MEAASSTFAKVPVMISEEDITECLRLVPDPELGLNIVDLGMVEQVDQREGHLRVQIVLTSAGCPLSGSIADAIDVTLRSLPGVETVLVEFPSDIQWSPHRLSPEARRILWGEAK
jgi:metal-sulfur cluster biosynthetic enzyme